MDLFDPQWWQSNIGTQVHAVMVAPIPFGFSVFAAAVLIFWVVRAHYRERIEALGATVSHKQSQLDEYKDRLHGTPIEVAKEITALQAEVERLKGSVYRPQRRITEDQRSKFVSAIENTSLEFQQTMLNVGHSPDTESTRYASALTKLFGEAGLSGDRIPGTHDEGEYGVIIYTSEPAPDDAARTLAASLREAGIPFEIRQQPDGMPVPIGANHYLHISPETD